jgi:hypothetical protein
MTELKKGDRVRVLSNKRSRSNNRVGDIGVIAVDDGTLLRYRVTVPGGATEGIWHYAEELELITEGGAPVARRTFKLIKDTPTLTKDAILQEACDDGTQEYVVLNHEAVKDLRPGVDIRRAAAIYDRSLVEDQPKWFVEVFAVEPQYMTREELDQWEAFKGSKTKRNYTKKVVEDKPVRKSTWTPAKRKAHGEKIRAARAAKKAK